jgi:hypothetical protein
MVSTTSTLTAAPTVPTFFTALERVRSRFLLPKEQVGRFSSDDVDDLLSGVRALRGGPAAWKRNAALIPRRQISLLFPALLRAEDEDLVERMQVLLETRATTSLHALGWAYFQNHYEDDRVVKAFQRLHAALSAQDGKSVPLLPPGDGGPLDGTLPKRIYDRIKETHVVELDPYFLDNGILVDTAFARSVQVLYFANCPDEGFVRNEDAFVRMLPELDAEDGFQVLAQYLKEHRIGSRYRTINEGILARVGPPDSGHVVWSKLPEKTRAKFWKWLVARAVEDHLSDNPRKFGLLVRYIPYMDTVRRLYENILVMGFGAFYLVDDRQTPDTTYFYDKASYEMWAESMAKLEPTEEELELYGKPSVPAPSPSENAHLDEILPSLPVQPAKRIVMETFKSSAVLIDCREVGLLFARDFLDDALGISRRGKETVQTTGAANRLF